MNLSLNCVHTVDILTPISGVGSNCTDICPCASSASNFIPTSDFGLLLLENASHTSSAFAFLAET